MVTRTHTKDPDRLAAEVTALTVSPQYIAVQAIWSELYPPGLRPHPGPVKVDTTVWVHGLGRWRPGVVEKVNARLGKVTYTVVHSTPAHPRRMYRKRVPIEDIRARAEYS